MKKMILTAAIIIITATTAQANQWACDTYYPGKIWHEASQTCKKPVSRATIAKQNKEKKKRAEIRREMQYKKEKRQHERRMARLEREKKKNDIAYRSALDAYRRAISK